MGNKIGAPPSPSTAEGGEGVAHMRDRWGGSASEIVQEKSVARIDPTCPPSADTLPALRAEEGECTR